MLEVIVQKENVQIIAVIKVYVILLLILVFVIELYIFYLMMIYLKIFIKYEGTSCNFNVCDEKNYKWDYCRAIVAKNPGYFCKYQISAISKFILYLILLIIYRVVSDNMQTT